MAEPPARMVAAVRLLCRDRGALSGILILALFIVAAAFAPQHAPYDPLSRRIGKAFLDPGVEHWLGTGKYGRDLASDIIYGARPALVIGVLSVLVSIAIGVPVGMLAGYRMDFVDRIVGTAVDIMPALPSLLLALMIVAVLGASTATLVAAIGISHVLIFIRMMVSGSILFEGQDLLALSMHDMSAVRGRQIGMVFQEPMTSLNPALTVGEQISKPLPRHLGL